VLVRTPFAVLTGTTIDCWRRTLGLGLRSDGTKFGLSAFGLDLFSDVPRENRPELSRESAEAHFVKRWTAFIANEPEARWGLRHGTHLVERVPDRPDIVVARFSDDGRLEKLEPYLLEADGRAPARSEISKISNALCAAHAATGELPERERPQHLLKMAQAELNRNAGEISIDSQRPDLRRIGGACQVSFEMMPESAGRCLPPDFRWRRTLGCCGLNVVARFSSDYCSVDVWLQIHHVASDGAPIQEMLLRVEKAWGIKSPPIFPKPRSSTQPVIRSVQPSPRDRPLFEVVDFLDFTPLLAWRERINARYRESMGGDAPVVCAVLWKLAQQPEFKGKKFSTAVDVPPGENLPRAVDLVGIRPADYTQSDEGFAEFARDYRLLLKKARLRSTPGWRMMQQIALLPPWLSVRALKLNAAQGRKIFGTIGVSMLKDARVFCAPMEDSGWYEGFVAIGNLALPAADGVKVAAVTARGGADTVRQYPGAICRAIASCNEII